MYDRIPFEVVNETMEIFALAHQPLSQPANKPLRQPPNKPLKHSLGLRH